MERKTKIHRRRGPHGAERWGEGYIRYSDNGQEAWALAPQPPTSTVAEPARGQGEGGSGAAAAFPLCLPGFITW